MIIDSGAGPTVIDTTYARTLGLAPREGGSVAGLTADAAIEVVSNLHIILGDLQVFIDTAVIVDLSSILSTTGETADILIGRDLFQNVIVDIDLPNRRLRIFQPTYFKEPTSSSSTLTIGDHGRCYIDIRVESNSAILAHYDLGSNSPLYLSPQYAQRYVLREGRPVSKSMSAGVEGPEVGRITMVRSVTIGGFTIHDVPAQIPTTWNQGAPALIGLPVLSRFRNIIDLGSKRVWLVPNEEALAKPFLKDRSGIGAVRASNGLTVVFIAPDSPAERAGLHVGDQIVTLDGATLGPAFFQVRPRPGAEPAGEKQVLGLADGRRIEIILRDYF